MIRTLLALSAIAFASGPAAKAQAPAAAARQTGTVTAVDGNKLSVTTAAKTQVSVAVAADAAVLQLPPCGTSLKQATPSTFASIASGDRVITGKPGDADTATRVILMKASDIALCKVKQQADWQKHGTGGIVKEVDGPVLTIAVGTRTLKVETTSATIFRRYADDSVSFEDARPGTLAQIQAGDQLSVRGAKSDDGTSIAAEEVVAGTFENLSGVLTSADAAARTVTLKDLISRKTVVVKLTANSDVRKLPAQAAAAFSTRGAGSAAGPRAAGAPPAAGATPATGEGRRNAGMDLSRMLARLPRASIADLHSGDAVMIVASQGHGAELTAITLLSGVETLLAATPSGEKPITLSPWTLGVPEGAGGGGGQ